MITRFAKHDLADKEGKYDLYYDFWYNAREFALPFNIVVYSDVLSFNFLCFHFERRKRYLPKCNNASY